MAPGSCKGTLHHKSVRVLNGRSANSNKPVQQFHNLFTVRWTSVDIVTSQLFTPSWGFRCSKVFFSFSKKILTHYFPSILPFETDLHEIAKDLGKTVSISFLTQHLFLRPNQWKTGGITWSSNGRTTGNISIAVSTQPENAYLELNYMCNGVPINYKVRLVSAPSNLGKGVVWFFVCPGQVSVAGNSFGRYLFLHRSAFRGCMYEKQTHSKHYRPLDKTLRKYYRADELYQSLHEKHFKKRSMPVNQRKDICA